LKKLQPTQLLNNINKYGSTISINLLIEYGSEGI